MSPLSREEARLLAGVSFVAARRGKLDAARTILDALRVRRPELPMPLAGLACVMLGRGLNDEACSLLDQACALATDADAADVQACVPWRCGRRAAPGKRPRCQGTGWPPAGAGPGRTGRTLSHGRTDLGASNGHQHSTHFTHRGPVARDG